MKRIYKGKSKLRILIDTKCDLSGYEDVSIVFMKPDESQFTVSAVVKDVESGIIFYDVQSEEELDQSGWWTLWLNTLNCVQATSPLPRQICSTTHSSGFV